MDQHSQPEALTECDREPIHEIGAVQAFGALIAVDTDWVVTHVSANCAEVLGASDAPTPGQELGAHFTTEAIASLTQALANIVEDDTVERLFGLRLNTGDASFDCAIHPSGKLIVIEFERHAEGQYQDHLEAIGPVMSKLSSAQDTASLCERAAALVRTMLGYDRVMIYRFHPDDSGEVVAEDRRDDLEPFLGLRYPSTDIPSQARALYCRNRFRIISDVDAPPARLEASASHRANPLDLSLSVLRASAPIHLQYLRNMDVAASLTIAIVRQGKLWGLIACHHSTPLYVPYSLRTVAEMFSQMFSLMLDRLLIEHAETQRLRGQALHEQLMRRFAQGASFVDDLDIFETVLGDCIGHDGTSVFVHDTYRSSGVAPEMEQFQELLPALNAIPNSQVLATHALSERFPEAKALENIAAGALVLPISRSPRDYLVLWRKPVTQAVRWGGEPAKAVSRDSKKLEPRNSFAAWVETVEGQSEEWSQDELMIADSLRITLLEVILRMTDEVARERKRAQEQQDLLVAELNHRVRNILNLIRALVSQSRKDAINVSDFASIIGGRISALATAHDNITRQNWAPAPLASLFESELEAYVAGKRGRLRMTEDAILIQPEAYTVLALVVHELVTNSAKYGSLCDSRGTIDIDIDHAANGDLIIKWRERGGPPVKPPARRGFGSTIIKRAIPHELRGEADLSFKLAGLEAVFRIPARYVVMPSKAPQKSLAQMGFGVEAEADADRRSVPEYVLLVEDNMIIALDTEDYLLDLGVKSVHMESTVAGALEAIERREPDFAIVDFNLGAESSQLIAEELAKRGVRFVLATGYSELASDLDELGAAGLIRKPYGSDEIKHALFGEEMKEGASLGLTSNA